MLSVLSVDPVSTVGWVSPVDPVLTVVPGGGSVVTNWQAVKLDSSRGSTSRLTHSSPPHVALMASSSLCLTSSRGRPWAWVILGIWIGAPSASPPPPRPTGDPGAPPPCPSEPCPPGCPVAFCPPGWRAASWPPGCPAEPLLPPGSPPPQPASRRHTTSAYARRRNAVIGTSPHSSVAEYQPVSI